MSAKHTPTPWRLEEGSTSYGPFIHGVFDATGRDLRVKGFALSGGKEAEANTRLIVLAVNSHDELIAALRECRAALTADTIGTVNMDDPDWYEAVAKAVAKADAALSRIPDIQIKGAA